jgi:hypothetical protein
MHVGGGSQYLTSVQGMPKAIEDQLTHKVRTFAWANKAWSPIALKTLQNHQNDGGRNILDLAARNEVIDIMWMKRYLSYGPSQPEWAALVDRLFQLARKADDTFLPDDILSNPFLQNWSVALYHKNKLHSDLWRMIQVSQKYKIEIEMLEVPLDAKLEMPIWLHPYSRENPRVKKAPAKTAKCL